MISDLIKCLLPKMGNQYAYTKGLSTTDDLVKFSSDIPAGLDKTDTVTLQGILLDFRKAFDRMRPDIAVFKLLSLNVSPSLVKVTMSFLTNRQPQVKSQENHQGRNLAELEYL